jgi:hypothetical protein
MFKEPDVAASADKLSTCFSDAQAHAASHRLPAGNMP